MGGTGGRWGRDVVLRLAVGSRWTRSVEGRWAGVEKWERSGGSRMRRLGGGRGELGVLTLVMLEIGVASSEGSAATLNLAGIGAFSGAEGSVAASHSESLGDLLDTTVPREGRRVGKGLSAEFAEVRLLPRATECQLDPR